MTKPMIAAALAILVAGSLAACSASAESASPSMPAPTQTAAMTTPQQESSVAAPEQMSPTTTRSPGPGSIKSEPGEDVFDFNIRKVFWATVQGDGATASLYQSDTYNKFRESAGYRAPSSVITTKCTLGARIPSTPEREDIIRRQLHDPALEVPGIRLFAYPVTCPDTSTDRAYVDVVVAAVNPSLKIEELQHTGEGGDVAAFGLASTWKG